MTAEADAITPDRAPYGSDRGRMKAPCLYHDCTHAHETDCGPICPQKPGALPPPIIPRPGYDGLDQAARALADVLGRPSLAKAITKALGPELTARLAARVSEIAARSALNADDKVSAEVIDRMMTESLARLAAAADTARARQRDLLEGDEPDAAELHRERFTGVSRG